MTPKSNQFSPRRARANVKLHRMDSRATASVSRVDVGSSDDDVQASSSRERATVRDVDRAIEELRKRRQMARAASRSVRENSTDSTSGSTPPNELDEELAAAIAEVEAAMGKLDEDATLTGAEALEAKQFEKENLALVEKTNSTKNKIATSATERNRVTGFRGPPGSGAVLGAGVFGATEASACEKKMDASLARAEAFAWKRNAGDEADKMSDTLSSWTKDIDAMLSKLDACDEVVRAKRDYFK